MDSEGEPQVNISTSPVMAFLSHFSRINNLHYYNTLELEAAFVVSFFFNCLLLLIFDVVMAYFFSKKIRFFEKILGHPAYTAQAA